MTHKLGFQDFQEDMWELGKGPQKLWSAGGGSAHAPGQQVSTRFYAAPGTKLSSTQAANRWLKAGEGGGKWGQGPGTPRFRVRG